MDVYEAVSGARMHAAYYRPAGSIATCGHDAAVQASKIHNEKEINKLNEIAGSLLDFLGLH